MTDLNPSIRWPAGHRSALSVIVHVPGLGLADESSRTSGLVGADYTATGLNRLLDTLADLDIRATVAFTMESATGAPQLLRKANELEHEVAASVCSSTGTLPDLLETISGTTGEAVHGLIEQLPGMPSADSEEPFGDESGSSWRITGANGDLPFPARNPDATIIPVSPYLIDLAWLDPMRPLPPSSLLETWSLTLAAHRTAGTFMPVVLHPHIAGRPGLLGTFSRFLDEVIAAGDVWVARLDHIARAWTELGPTSQEP